MITVNGLSDAATAIAASNGAVPVFVAPVAVTTEFKTNGVAGPHVTSQTSSPAQKSSVADAAQKNVALLRVRAHKHFSVLTQPLRVCKAMQRLMN